jgi:hypothetical protein
METLGFVSIDGLSIGGSNNHKAVAQKSKLTFARRYIDNNAFSMRHHSGKDEESFPTEHGLNISKAIGEARKSLDLTHKYGCAPHNYWVSRRPYPHNESIFTLINSKILPQTLSKSSRYKDGRKALIITNTGAIRFDIFKGAFTKDTKFLVSPFTSAFRYLPDISYEAASQVIKLLNNEGPIMLEILERNAVLPPPEVYAARYRPHMLSPEVNGVNLPQHSRQQVPIGREEPSLTPGYTTKDDAGKDGDDTVHSEIQFYDVSNCIQATVGFDEDEHEPLTVDLVYNEFIQQWVLLALEYTGQKYTSDDTKIFDSGKSFTDMMTEWVEEHWGSEGECST